MSKARALTQIRFGRRNPRALLGQREVISSHLSHLRSHYLFSVRSVARGRAAISYATNRRHSRREFRQRG